MTCRDRFYAVAPAPPIVAPSRSLGIKNSGDQHSIRDWPLGFCDCFGYRNGDKDCQWCPYFVPMALCGTCFLVGKIRTLYVEEKPFCCDMGPQGCCLCLISCPINLAGPLGGFCWFALNSAKIRHDIVKQYNIDDSHSKECCCCILSTCCVGIILLQFLLLKCLDLNDYRLRVPMQFVSGANDAARVCRKRNKAHREALNMLDVFNLEDYSCASALMLLTASLDTDFKTE